MLIIRHKERDTQEGRNEYMKVVILAGGRGTRISEESTLKPKPMIEIGEHPILWHIMKYYSSYGYNDFIICCGYKGYMIKEYFADYYLHNADVTFDFTDDGKMIVHNHEAEPWKVTLVNTGLNTQTGARIRKVRKYIGDEAFMLTYGDGVSNVPIDKLVEFHKKHGKIGTMTAVQPGGRFGVLGIDGQMNITSFMEKSKEDGGWINGGFMVLEQGVFSYIGDNDEEIFEREPLEHLAMDGELVAYKHTDFWHCMDTMRDRIVLEEMWSDDEAPWKRW